VVVAETADVGSQAGTQIGEEPGMVAALGPHCLPTHSRMPRNGWGIRCDRLVQAMALNGTQRKSGLRPAVTEQ